MLPYTAEVLYALFGQYNQAIWPIQPLFLVLAGVALGLALRPARQTGRAVGTILALAWLWTAIAFHWQHFAQIHFAAGAYAVLFLLQALLLLWTLVLRGRTTFRLGRAFPDLVALTVLCCALLLYPVLDWWAGYPWPQWRLFGVAPGPTMLFTLGLLVLTQPRVPYHLVVIPLLWLAIAAWSAWALGMAQDSVPAIAGMVAMLLILARTRAFAGRSHRRS
jgi:hypothetical protein